MKYEPRRKLPKPIGIAVVFVLIAGCWARIVDAIARMEQAPDHSNLTCSPEAGSLLVTCSVRKKFTPSLRMAWVGVLAAALLCPSFSLAEDAELAKLFAEEVEKATIVISSLKGDKHFVYNEQRASKRVCPASTFKIPNTLIAAAEGVVSGPDAKFEWDGVERMIAEWNRDQTLMTAFQVSCVWCYQEIARNVGKPAYKTHLRTLEYGTLSEPFELTEFWLDGSLKISPLEQIAFLKKVYLRQFPLEPSAYETLRTIMLVQENKDYAIRAKTGWAARLDPKIGWYVGFVETRGSVWFFAMNIDSEEMKNLYKRQELTMAALRLKGILGSGVPNQQQR